MPVIALFGATGNVGKELLKVLKEKAAVDDSFLVFTRGDSLPKGLDLDDRFKATNLPQKEEGDSTTTDSDTLANILSSNKAETAFLCLPQLLVFQYKEYAQELVQALKSAGSIKRVVKVGTVNAAQYEYGRHHLASEQVIRDSGLKLTVLEAGDYSTNPHWLGPGPPGAPYAMIDIFKGMSILSKIGMPSAFRSMGNVANFFGTAKEPFLDLRDFADALAVVILNAEAHEGKTYKVNSDSVTMAEVAEIYGELLGRKIYVLDMTEDEMRFLFGLDGIKDEMADLLVEMMTQFQKGVYEADATWDGFAKLLPDQTPRNFKDFAKEKVSVGWKPPRLW